MANQYTSIVVAIDGSKEAEYAFHKSIDVATRNEGTIHMNDSFGIKIRNA